MKMSKAKSYQPSTSNTKEQFNRINNEKVNIRLEKKLKMDIDLANKLGLRGTPAFVVGNEIIFGYVPANELLNKIN